MEPGNLLAAAAQVLKNAYAPYSGYRVGAALLGKSGKVYTGCNVENASYGLSLCAERVAVAKAVAAGERKFQALAVVSESSPLCFPCGACLQFLAEFGPVVLVIKAASPEGYQMVPLEKALPYPFILNLLRKEYPED